MIHSAGRGLQGRGMSLQQYHSQPQTGEPVSAIANLNRDTILTQVAQGRLLKHIAADLGVTPAAISQQLAQDDQYRQAREIGAEARLEQQYENIEGARDSLNLARAREAFRAASFTGKNGNYPRGICRGLGLQKARRLPQLRQV